MNYKDKDYYAHSMKIYNTKEEKDNINFLNHKGFNILCPNNDIGELGSLKPYLDIVKSCNKVIVTEYKKHIGKGVYEEIQIALSNNIPVYVLRDRKLKKVKLIKVFNSRDWKIEYGKIII